MTIEPATTPVLVWLSSRLRREDVAEVRASSGRDPLTSLMRALTRPGITLVARIDGEPAAAFGVSEQFLLPDGRTAASPWMLGTDLMTANGSLVTRASRAWLPVLSHGIDVLVNNIDSRNRRHLAWCKRMGFEVSDHQLTMHDPTVKFLTITKDV